MEVTYTSCVKQISVENTELNYEIRRNCEVQIETDKGRTRRKWWYRCSVLFLFLVVTTAVIFIEVDFRQSPLYWRHWPWYEKRVTNATVVSTASVINDQYFVKYPHKYRFLVDEPEKCQQQQPFLVLMVPVAPHNKAARDAVRSTWGSERLVLDKVVCLFFLLALPSGDGEQQLQEQVLQESREHQDMLQSDFKDSYKNLTIKTMVILEWLSSRCPNASYAMKIDSDMFLNVHTLVNMLLTAPKQNYMTGLVANGAAVLRDPSSKWYLPWEVFPESNYPRYALGLGYVLSLDLPRKIVEASRHVRAIYIEDVYLGLCMRQLGISPSFPPNDNLFQGYQSSIMGRCFYNTIITTILHTPQELLDVWSDLKQNVSGC